MGPQKGVLGRQLCGPWALHLLPTVPGSGGDLLRESCRLGDRSGWLSRPAVPPRGEALGQLPASPPSSLPRGAPRGHCGRHLRGSNVMGQRTASLPTRTPASPLGPAPLPGKKGQGCWGTNAPSVPEVPVTAGVGGPHPQPLARWDRSVAGFLRGLRETPTRQPVACSVAAWKGLAFPCPREASPRLLNLPSTLASGAAPEQLGLGFLTLGAGTVTNWQQEQRP